MASSFVGGRTLTDRHPWWSNRSARACFLCYDSVGDHAPPSIAVHPATFEQQLETLLRCGYSPGDGAALRSLAAGERPQRPLAFLSFDDGFRDTYAEAFPRLLAWGFRAMVFVVPPLVDTAGSMHWPELGDLPRRLPAVFRSVDWRGVEAMAEAGMEIGSHTCHHPWLLSLGDEPLRQELVDSRARIVDRLGACDAIAYPYGVCTPRLAAAARDAGYRFGFSLPYGATGVGWQRGSGRLEIPRVAVEDRDGTRRFRLKVTRTGRSLLLSRVKAVVRTAEARGRRRDGAYG